MKVISETGHAKNIANLQDLISFCQGYGNSYVPAKASLTVVELQKLYQTALTKLNAVKTQKTTFDNATNERRNAFFDLKLLGTKVVNAFVVSGADALAIDDVRGINKKLQGASKKAKDTPVSPTEVVTSTKSISTSQQSYDRQIDHLANLIEVLTQSTFYSPNETELQLTALNAKLSDLQTKNLNLINSYTNYSNAIIERNVILYNPLTGLIQTAKEVKFYVKSVFGTNSPQYRQVSGLEFKFIRTE
jgi:hypothetical protein